jgi:hypothetical protein
MATDTPIVNLSKETLDQITPALHSMRDSLKNQTRLLQKTFDLQQASMQDADRRANLAQSQVASIDPEVTSSSTSNSSNTSGGTFIAGGGMMMPAAIALVASIAGFDDLLRAIALPKMIKGFGENLDKLKTNLNSIGTRITDFGAKIKNFKFPDLPTIGFVDKTGSPYDFSKINARLTAPFDTLNTKITEVLTPATESIAKSVDDFKLTTTAWFDGIKSSVTTKIGAGIEAIDTSLDTIKATTNGFIDGVKLSAMSKLTPAIELAGTKIDSFKTSITGFLDSANSRATSAFTGTTEVLDNKATAVKTSVQKFFDGIPRLKITMPEGIGAIGDSIKAVFGSLDEGTGVLGFLGKVAGFLKPLLTPFEFVLKTVMRPITQIFLSLIDFVVGFYNGFTGTDGGFGDKLKAGIEGGVLGIIKGFTEAIDMIFIDLPAWLLEKLGFKGIADKLREFSLTAVVDPVWEAVKNFFKNMFNDPSGTMMSIARGAGNMAENFIKTILRMILPDPGADRAWYDPRGLVAKAIPDSVYEYAGMNPQTGAILPNVAAELASQRSAMVQNDAANSAARQAAAIAASVNVGPTTVVNKGGNSRTIMLQANPKISSHMSFAGGF